MFNLLETNMSPLPTKMSWSFSKGFVSLLSPFPGGLSTPENELLEAET